MTVDEFIASNPSKEEVAKQLCRIANQNVLGINDTWAWGLFKPLYNFKISDFYDDKNETREKYDDYAVEVVGIVNWKYKGKYGLWEED